VLIVAEAVTKGQQTGLIQAQGELRSYENSSISFEFRGEQAKKPSNCECWQIRQSALAGPF